MRKWDLTRSYCYYYTLWTIVTCVEAIPIQNTEAQLDSHHGTPIEEQVKQLVHNSDANKSVCSSLDASNNDQFLLSNSLKRKYKLNIQYRTTIHIWKRIVVRMLLPHNIIFISYYLTDFNNYYYYVFSSNHC